MEGGSGDCCCIHSKSVACHFILNVLPLLSQRKRIIIMVSRSNRVYDDDDKRRSNRFGAIVYDAKTLDIMAESRFLDPMPKYSSQVVSAIPLFCLLHL